ncbi:MAG TPA: Sua5/YciO/YrdC/YwlC family protein [Spirochaetota bacterium]|mgnify:FL=1|jgi:tRNA A37 threonylcarbamoyladenosine synthetase subunit TsaC/SUA5/YrdC|nr:Sua5/YciO/YrdC/YwlC family protein [Spirochaetota bacterium]
MKTEIISIKKLKKDGTIDPYITRSLSDMIKSGKTVLMPVDAIYGLVCINEPSHREHIEKLTGDTDEHIVRMISSFKMLNEIANIDKLEFDFMHRIWPGELIVYVEDSSARGKAIPVRMPRSKYQQDIIEHVGKPCLYAALLDKDKKPVFRKKEIIAALEGKIDCLLLIDEFCKEHTLPSVVDISKGTLTIINEGRVSTEEIKSLYFLGKDDSVL